MASDPDLARGTKSLQTPCWSKADSNRRSPVSGLALRIVKSGEVGAYAGGVDVELLPPLRDMPFPRSVIASGALPSGPAKGLAEMPARPPSNRSADLSREE